MLAVGCFHAQEACQHVLTGFLSFQELGTILASVHYPEAKATKPPAELQPDQFWRLFRPHSQTPIIMIMSCCQNDRTNGPFYSSILVLSLTGHSYSEDRKER